MWTEFLREWMSQRVAVRELQFPAASPRVGMDVIERGCAFHFWFA